MKPEILSIIENDPSEFFNVAPPELLIHLFEYISPEFFPSIALVNHNMNSIANDNKLWMQKYKKHFPYEFTFFVNDNPSEVDWRIEFTKTRNYKYRYLESVRDVNFLIVEGDLDSIKSMRLDSHLASLKKSNADSYLDVAFKNKQKEMLQYFYQKKELVLLAKPISDQRNKDLLGWAIACHQEKKIEELSEFLCVDSNFYPNHWVTALQFGCLSVVKTLFTSSPHLINQSFATFTHSNSTPLITAASAGYVDVVAFLVNNGAFLHPANATLANDTALHCAISNGHSDVAFFLINKVYENNADLNRACYKGRYQLIHKAAAKCSVEVVATLLDKLPENLNLQDDSLMTPLIEAIINRNFAVAQFLIQRGADVNHNTKSTQHTPLFLALTTRQDKLAILLINAGAETKFSARLGTLSMLHIAARYGCIETVKTLLKTHSIDEPDRYGNTPLIEAVKHGHKSLVKYLLEHNADMQKLCNGKNALHYACLKGNEEIALLLMKNNADYFAKSSNGKIASELIPKSKKRMRICFSILSVIKRLQNKLEKMIDDEDKKYLKREEQLRLATKFSLLYFSGYKEKFSETDIKECEKSKKLKPIAQSLMLLKK